VDLDLQWLLWGLPVAFALGWMASRLDVRQWKRERRDAPRAYFNGLNLLLNEQQDKAIDAFIEAVQQDPDTSDLHFALGNLFRRRGEYQRAVRVHEHLLQRSDLPKAERERAQHALAQDFLKAGLLDRAEAAFKALAGTAYATEARLELLGLHERARDWRAAIGIASQLEGTAAGSFSARMAHYWCELALEADAKRDNEDAARLIAHARAVAPLAARPSVLAGRFEAAAGRHAQALAAWDALLPAHGEVFTLIAGEYAHSAVACEQGSSARQTLLKVHEQRPSVELLQAIGQLEPDAQTQHARLLALLAAQPTLSAAQELLRRNAPPAPQELPLLREAVAQAARPLQRYRCAACGFETQQYFWQCPGCLSWDSYPAQRIELL
jgi:lipopolysaccharide biosynthesis regulator YciM